MTKEPHPHQLSPEEWSTAVDRTAQNQAKAAAYEAYLAANRVLALLDETAEPAWIVHAATIREHACALYRALVHDTEW